MRWNLISHSWYLLFHTNVVLLSLLLTAVEGGTMSKYIPGNQKHLTLEDRIYIENELNKGTSFKDFVKKTGSFHRWLSRDSRPIRSSPTIRNLIFLSGQFIPISIRDCSQLGMLTWNAKWNSNHASVIKHRSQTGLFLSIGRIRTSRLCSFHSLLKWILYTPQGIQRKRCLHFSSQGKSCFLLFWWTVVQKVLSASYLTA